MNFDIQGDKPLTQVELLTLCMIPEEGSISAPKVMQKLEEIMSGHWTPKRGSIYPILHRLSSRQLLNQDEDASKMSFQRSEDGSSLIVTLSESLLNQMRSNFIFLRTILSEIIKVDPYSSLHIIGRMQDDLNEFEKDIKLLNKVASEKDQEDGWTDISVG